jgi:predicted Zn-dependent peptidase
MIENIKSSNELSGFYIIFQGSCNLERPGIYGLSHLMEHLVCKSFDHLQDELDENGISWNAYTSGNEIVFYWTGLEENLSKYRGKFLDLISDFKITEEEFQNEKNIVIQEYFDAFNDQAEAHYLNMCRKEFDHYGPIGLLEDLQSLTLKDCQDYFKLQYSKPSKIINVSKEDMNGLKDKNFKNFSEFTADPFSYDIKKNEGVKLEKMNQYDGKRSILIFSEPVIDPSHIAPVQMISAMLSSGLNSPLYQEIREKLGLVYYIQNWIDRTGNVGRNFIASLTTEENVEKFQTALYKVLDDPKTHLTEKRFNVIKNKLIISYKKNNINLHSNVNKYITPKDWVLENFIETITLKDCISIYDMYFKSDKLTFTTDKEY